MATITAKPTVRTKQDPVLEQEKQSRPGVRMPIRVKITLPYLLLAAVLAIGAAYVSTNIIFDTLEERFTNQLIESGKLASEWMVREENRLIDSLRLLTFTQGLAEALKVRDAESLRQLSLGITVNNREEAVEFLDDQGVLVLSMQHIPGGNVEEYAFSSHGDQAFIQWDFVTKVLEGTGDQLGNKYAGLVQAEWGDYFYISGPVYDSEGNFAGVILVGKTLATLTRQIREQTLTQATLYDFKGIPLASTFYNAPSISKTEITELLEYQDSASIQRELPNRRELNVSNIDYSEIIAPWEVRGDVDLGVLGTSLVKSFLVSTSQVTRLQITLVVAATFMLVILIGYQVAKIITQPLTRLVRASIQVAQGDLNVQVEPQSQDEISILTSSFNDMVQSLKASQHELLGAYERTLQGWSKALELRDEETEGHTLRVTELTTKLAKEMGFEGDRLVHIQRGALLHDIGKLGIPDAILLKPGPLTDEEWEIMRRHPVYAYELLYPIEYLRPALDIPHFHHEWWNGNGYPERLKGENIPLPARIFAVVDAWDAMTSDRPYRAALPKEKALMIIKETSGTHFDPQVVSLFLQFANGNHRER